MAKKKKQEEAPAAGAPLWMVTYGDLMSLLLCFFVLIVSFSTMDKTEFKAALGSLKQALTVFGEAGKSESFIHVVNFKPYPAPMSNFYRYIRQGKVLQDHSGDLSEMQEQREIISDVTQEVTTVVRKLGISEAVSVAYTGRGVKIRIPSTVLFSVGSVQLNSEAKEIMKKIAMLLKRLPYLFSVEGHTDNLPVAGPRFKSNWELSSTRAISVVEFLIESGVDPTQLAAVGYGEYKPIGDNTTKKGRMQNRRVEIDIDVSSKLAK